MSNHDEKVWRYIDSGALDGATNMATDEALSRFEFSLKPILRVYRWQPFTISLGYNQKFEEIDIEKCQEDRVDVVRRPTGGRAIFHAHEVTYSVILPKASPWFFKNTLAVYNQISSALVVGLQELGLPVVLERMTSNDHAFKHYKNRFACFATSAKYEIHFQGKKLVGSAQRRFEKALLQHGSILLGNEHLNLLNYLATNGDGAWHTARNQLHKSTICIETILNRTVRYEEVAQALQRGFEKYFNVTLKSEPLTPQEWQKINEIKPEYSRNGAVQKA
jgi:lipoate-protein ligase A